MEDKLKEIGVIQKGNFTFKSGQKSNIYFDLRRLYSYPETLKEVITELQNKTGRNFDHVCGVPSSGIPFSSFFSCLFNVPLLLLRQEKKDHGTKKILEGIYKTGDTVLLIEDVCTTGSSINEAKNQLQEEGLIVTMTCIIDRRKEESLEITSLFKATDFLKRKFYNPQATKIWECMQRKKSNICFSCDGGSLEILKTVAPHVCMVKIHTDIRIDNWLLDVYDLADEYDFIVLDDRKYADIGYIVSKQVITSGLCTVHSICGESTILGLKEKCDGCFLIAELSSKDNLITPLYTQMTFELGKEHKDFVAGFICQKRGDDDQFLYLTPGVGNNIDSFGQQYREISEIDTDIFIIGRSIYESTDPLQAVLNFKTQAWK